jgi:hypothetical protein
MRKNTNFFKMIVGLLSVAFVTASATQVFMNIKADDQNQTLNGNRGDNSPFAVTWEDTFNDATKIDPNPPGAGQSDNYNVSVGQVSMINTFAAWTDPAWTKMKPITISNTAGQTLYNSIVYFTITHITGMQSQFQDIRFKHQNNPTTWLNYWIEKYNTTTAQVWVKVPSIPAGTSTMYLFYGNPSATSQSNYSGVFSWTGFWASDEKTTNHGNKEGTWDPDVAYGNSEFLVAWEEGEPWYLPWNLGFKQEIRASIYDTNGNKLVDDKQVFNDGTVFYRNENPSVDYGGGKYFVAWEHYDTVANPSATTENIKARTVVRNGDQLQLGSVIDVCTAADCQADANVQYDSVNNRFCVVWEDARNGESNYNIYGRLYDTNGNPVGGEKGIATATYSQCEPTVAFDPIHKHYIIAWEEGITGDNGPFSIKGGIFDENLNQISTFTVATGSSSIDYNFPSVEFCVQTQRFLVTWNDDDISSGDWWGNIWGKIYDSSGSVVVNTFQIKSGEFVRTDIAPYFSSSFFVSFNSKGSSGSGLIWGKILSSTGDFIGNDIQLSLSSSALADWANIAVGNNKVFVSWEDIRITYPDPFNDMPDVYSNLWSCSIAGSSVTYSIGSEKQLILSAHVTSIQIIPTNFHHWDIFNATYTDGTITFDILDGATGALLLPNVLPGSNLFTQGVTAATIRLKATFTRANPSTTPKLDKWSIRWQTNQPPAVPSSPNPGNGSTDVSVTTDLSWIGGDPDGDPVTYDVYFGITTPPVKVAGNQTSTSYDTGTMTYGTTYYWKIVSWDNHGASAAGPLWHFTTHNDPPTIPGTPNPVNGATGVSVNADLSWTGGDPNPGDSVTYDVYFGLTTPPTQKVSANQSSTSYDPGTMQYNMHYYWKIVAWDTHGASSAGPIWDFTTENRAPYEPNTPSPPQGATGVSITADLSWVGGDPDGDPVTYDVYFGTSSTPPKVASNQSATTYDLPVLTYGTTYHWKIVSWDNHGASTSSPLWNFMTNSLPNEPSNPNPQNHATGVDIHADLGWTGGDPDPGDTVLYDVYFGTSSSPPKVSSNQTATSYDPGTMSYLVTYHWKIVAWDNHGASKAGPLWDFTTTFVPNNPPYVPSNPNPANQSTAVPIDTDLSWVGGDPDPGDIVTYDVYFGATNPPPLVSVAHPTTSYDPGTLSYTTMYYWRIVAWDDRGASTPGPLWHFTTTSVPNNPPYVPSSPTPVNHATGVNINANLGWTGGDPDPGDTVLYDVYFGTSSPPPKVFSNHSGTYYDPGTMDYLTTYYWKIVAWDNHGASSTGPLWDFTTENQVNTPPYLPSDPQPANHAIDVSINADLGWNGGDPDPGDTVTYDVYFGTTSPPSKIIGNQSATTYDPGTMNYLTTYYWKIVAWDNHGASTQGSLWDFTTIQEPNEPPYTPSDPTPANGATNVDVTVMMSWTGGDPNPGDTVTYDVYFGTTTSPPQVTSNQSATTYDPGTLAYTTTYYWKIVAWDNHGLSTPGALWHFTTKAEPNNPPYTPDDPTPADGAANVSIDTALSWTGGDPDAGDTVTYDVYFGITSPPPKLASNISGTSYQPTTLEQNTTYYWKIVAWDSHGASTTGAMWLFTTETLGDVTPPHLTIVKPEKAIYFLNTKILPFIATIVFFAVDVEVSATDNESGVAKVEFYVDDVLKTTDTTAPYSWTWSERGFLFYTLTVKAYDNAGHKASIDLNVWKFF